MSNSQINLPKTAFSMKANLPVREPEILEYWKKINLYNFNQYSIICSGFYLFIVFRNNFYFCTDLRTLPIL